MKLLRTEQPDNQVMINIVLLGCHKEQLYIMIKLVLEHLVPVKFTAESVFTNSIYLINYNEYLPTDFCFKYEYRFFFRRNLYYFIFYRSI